MKVHTLLTDSQERFQKILEAAAPIEFELVEHQNPETLVTTLSSEILREPTLLIYEGMNLEFIANILSINERISIALIITERDSSSLKQLFSHPNVNFFMSDAFLENKNALSHLLLTIGRRNIPKDLSSYFPPNTPKHTFIIDNSAMKSEILEHVEMKILESVRSNFGRIAETYSSRATIVLDELILNAIFNANPRLKLHDRSIPVVLSESEQVQVDLCLSPTVFGISVIDKFGTLKKNNIIKHFCSIDLSPKIEHRSSGGLGLRLSLDSSSELIFVVEEGISTRVTALTHIEPSVKSFRDRPKSFFYFIANGG